MSAVKRPRRQQKVAAERRSVCRWTPVGRLAVRGARSAEGRCGAASGVPISVVKTRSCSCQLRRPRAAPRPVHSGCVQRFDGRAGERHGPARPVVLGSPSWSPLDASGEHQPEQWPEAESPRIASRSYWASGPGPGYVGRLHGACATSARQVRQHRQSLPMPTPVPYAGAWSPPACGSRAACAASSGSPRTPSARPCPGPAAATTRRRWPAG